MPVFSSQNQPKGRGRKKGSLNSSTILHTLLSKKTESNKETPSGTKKKLSKLLQIYNKHIDLALAGNVKSAMFVLDRYEGKPINIIEDSNHKTLVIMPAGARPEPGQVIHTIAKPLKQGTPSDEDDE